jgi:hypothetical protein
VRRVDVKGRFGDHGVPVPFMKRRAMSVAVALALATAASTLIAEDAALVRARAFLANVPLPDLLDRGWTSVHS